MSVSANRDKSNQFSGDLSSAFLEPQNTTDQHRLTQPQLTQIFVNSISLEADH